MVDTWFFEGIVMFLSHNNPCLSDLIDKSYSQSFICKTKVVQWIAFATIIVFQIMIFRLDSPFLISIVCSIICWPDTSLNIKNINVLITDLASLTLLIVHSLNIDNWSLILDNAIVLNWEPLAKPLSDKKKSEVDTPFSRWLVLTRRRFASSSYLICLFSVAHRMFIMSYAYFVSKYLLRLIC